MEMTARRGCVSIVKERRRQKNRRREPARILATRAAGFSNYFWPSARKRRDLIESFLAAPTVQELAPPAAPIVRNRFLTLLYRADEETYATLSSICLG